MLPDVEFVAVGSDPRAAVEDADILVTERDITEVCVATARQLQGKELSYNNIGDTDAALECIKQFEEGPACVIVKHANPCGVAVAGTILEAYNKAFKTDPTSAFGGIIAFNRELDAETARTQAAVRGQQRVDAHGQPAAAAGRAGRHEHGPRDGDGVGRRGLLWAGGRHHPGVGFGERRIHRPERRRGRRAPALERETDKPVADCLLRFCTRS